MSAYRLSADEKLAPTELGRPRRTFRRFLLDQLTYIALFLMVLLLVGIVLFPYMVVNVPSGHVGVLWLRFRGGTVLDPRQLKEEGFRIISPWNKVFLYDLRLQSRTDTYTAISKDGVNVIAGINIRFRLKHDSVPQLHQSVGPNFVTSLVVPEIGNRMREVIADYLAEEVYSTKRQEIQDKIRSRAEAMLGEKMMDRQETEDYAPYRIPLYAMLNLVDTLILGIELPPSIVTAINRKQEQYYIAQEYTFRVEREVKESQRKKIEAEGIREFQQIVSQGISDSYLRWRGIEATLQLAQSQNSKVVIIGSGKDGVPIILGNADSAAPPPATPPPTPGSGPRPTAAPPATAAEKVPASGLATPAETIPTPAEPTVPRAYFPFPLSKSDIEALWSRLTDLPKITEEPAPAPKPQ
jgi:regulator of protease activity HflC (stomatin/prohibitin superfamily)